MNGSDNERKASSVLPEIPKLLEFPDSQEGSSQKKVKLKSKKRRAQLTINLTGCKYDSVRRVARRFGIKAVGDDEDWTIFWTDTSIVPDRVTDMKRYQKINHFPGMIDICRKDQLARNMNRMKKQFPKEYNIFPASWCLPADSGEFQAYFRSKKNKTFISKPESGCQGKGIFVFKNFKEINDDEHCVVQQYISKPFIMDGFKFDLRIYVLVTSCDPLRVFVYYNGLGRFATVRYHEPQGGNLGEQCMHLTNYAINKTSKDFVRDDDVGSKRKLTVVNKWFVDNGYDIKNIWNDIDDVIIKTLIAAHPKLKHNYRTCFPHHSKGSACFELLGFDVLLDRKLKPWLIEVNHSPSFHTDAPLDKEVKEGLLHDTFNLIDLYANDKRKCIEEDRRKVRERLLLKQKSKEESQSAEEEIRAKYMAHLDSYEMSHAGGFRRIYPNNNEERYAKFFDQGPSLCAETTSSKARSELSKQQREEIATKQKEIDAYRKKFSGVKPVLSTTDRKNDEVRPESPSFGERKGKITYNRRRGYFQLPVPLYTPQSSKSLKCSSRSTTIAECHIDSKVPVEKPDIFSLTEVESDKTNDQPSPAVPHACLAVPQEIKDEEEMERLEGMRLRDNLVKEMGISKHVQASLNTVVTQIYKINTSSIPSSQIQTNEHEYVPKVYSQTSRVTTAGTDRMVPLSTNILNCPQPLVHMEQNCHYAGMLHRSNSTHSVVPGQHSSIKIAANNGTLMAIRPTPPHYPPPSHRKFGNYHRKYFTRKMPGQSYVHSKQKCNPSQSWGPSHKQYNLSESSYLYTYDRSMHGSIGMATQQKKVQHLQYEVDPPVNTTSSDMVAIGLSVSSAPIHLFHRETQAPTFHPTTDKDWINCDTMIGMSRHKKNFPVMTLKMKRLETLPANASTVFF